MSSMVFAVAGIESWPIDFRTPLVWLGLGFGVAIVGAMLWILLGSLRRRWTGHHVRCPVDGAAAHVFVERDDDGRAVDVAVCSRLSPPGHVTCSRGCLASVPSRA